MSVKVLIMEADTSDKYYKSSNLGPDTSILLTKLSSVHVSILSVRFEGGLLPTSIHWWHSKVFYWWGNASLILSHKLITHFLVVEILIFYWYHAPTIPQTNWIHGYRGGAASSNHGNPHFSNRMGSKHSLFNSEFLKSIKYFLDGFVAFLEIYCTDSCL